MRFFLLYNVLRLNRRKTIYLSKTDLNFFKIDCRKHAIEKSTTVEAFPDVNRREDLKQKVIVFKVCVFIFNINRSPDS